MMEPMSRLLGEIRELIEGSGESRYSLARRCGVDEGRLSRLMSGERGLSIDAIEQLADALGFEVVLKPKRSGRKGG